MGTLENRRKLTAVRGMGAALVGFAGWIVLYVVFGLIEPNIFTTNNMLNLLRSMAKYLLVGVGQGVILITGNIDLSIGSVVAMSAMISATMMSHGTAAIVAVCAAIVCCLAVGVINGLLVGKFKLPPFIATLGTQTIIYGISLVFTDAQPIGGFQESYNNLINGCIGDPKGFYLPYLLFVAVIFGLFFWFLYNNTCHGKYMYAIGGNEIAAEVSGVNTKKAKILIYMTAGIMYAMAGYLLAAKSGGASASMGNGYELEAIAGCTIGGVSTTGGIGTIGGVLVGVLVFEFLKIVLQFLGVNPYYNYMVQGIVIVTAVALDIRKYIAKK